MTLEQDLEQLVSEYRQRADEYHEYGKPEAQMLGDLYAGVAYRVESLMKLHKAADG